MPNNAVMPQSLTVLIVPVVVDDQHNEYTSFVAALFGFFLETNKHQNLTRLSHLITNKHQNLMRLRLAIKREIVELIETGKHELSIKKDTR